MPPYVGGIPERQPAERSDLVDFQRQLPPQVWRRASQPWVRAGTVGSGDDLLVLAWSAGMLEEERAAGVAMLAKFGVRAGMRIANTLPGALSTPGSLLFGDVVEELGGLDIPLGPIRSLSEAQNAWSTLMNLRAEVLVTDCRSGELLLEGVVGLRENPAIVGWIWLVERPWLEGPTFPEPLQQVWRRYWLPFPEAQCFFAWSCAWGTFHLHSPERVGPVASSMGPFKQLVVRARWRNEEPDVVLPWPAQCPPEPCACGQGGVIRFRQT